MNFTTSIRPEKPIAHIPFINYADFQLEEESSFIALAEYKDGSKNLIHLVVQDGNNGADLAMQVSERLKLMLDNDNAVVQWY